VTGAADVSSGPMTIELYANDSLDPSGFGEGQTFVGAVTLASAAPFVTKLSTGLAGRYITATATDAGGNTSEFSAGIAVQAGATDAGPGAQREGRWMDIHPNPVKNEASIRFHLAKAEMASVMIYDVKGRKVRTLAERRSFLPGLHEIEWRGVDQRGESVAPGVYFLRLEGSFGTEVRKLLLIR